MKRLVLSILYGHNYIQNVFKKRTHFITTLTISICIYFRMKSCGVCEKKQSEQAVTVSKVVKTFPDNDFDK